MALFGAAVSDFGGLDLRNDADASACIDMLNIDLDVSGRMRTRDGFATWTTSPAASGFRALIPLPTIVSAGQIISPLVNGTVEAVNATTGALVAASGATNATIYNLTPFNAAAGPQVAYGPAGTIAGTMLKWDGATFSNVAFTAGTFAPYATNINTASFAYTIVTPIDARLVLAGSDLSPAGIDLGSIVVFSNAGAPETVLSTNYVLLAPGDGERIRGICNFGNQMIVFKESKYFVFTGTTTDASGNPVFNYRTVNMGIGIHPAAKNGGCTTGPDGVYFIGRDGVYKTTGGAPLKISGIIDPIFGVGGPTPPYFQGQTLDFTVNSTTISCVKNRLYMTYAGSGGTATLVYDIPSQQWMYWSPQSFAFCANPVDGALMMSYSQSVSSNIGRFAAGLTTDFVSTGISGRYRTGFFTFDYRGRTPTRAITGVEKIVRETIVDGMGTVSYTLSNQWVRPANLAATRTLTLGTSPQVAQARDRTAVKGRAFSMQFSGTAPWTVERAVLNLHGYEPTGVKET